MDLKDLSKGFHLISEEEPICSNVSEPQLKKASHHSHSEKLNVYGGGWDRRSHNFYVKINQLLYTRVDRDTRVGVSYMRYTYLKKGIKQLFYIPSLAARAAPLNHRLNSVPRLRL